MTKDGAKGLVTHDIEGSELSDLEAARAEAIRRIRELLHQEANGPPNLDRHVLLTDEAGTVLAVVQFRDAV